MFSLPRSAPYCIALSAILCILAKAQTDLVTDEELSTQKNDVVQTLFKECNPKLAYLGPTPCKKTIGWNPVNPLIVHLPPDIPLSECAVVTEFSDPRFEVAADNLSPATRKNGVLFSGKVLLTFTTARTAQLTNGVFGPWSEYSDFERPLAVAGLRKDSRGWMSWTLLIPGTSLGEVRRFKDEYLSCSSDQLTLSHQRSPKGVPPRKPFDTFSFLDNVPLAKRRFSGTEQAFEEGLPAFIRQSVDQSGLPPRDYQSDTAQIIDIVRHFSSAKLDDGSARSGVANELHFARDMGQDDNGQSVYFRFFDTPSDHLRPIMITVGPPAGGWSTGHEFEVEVRFSPMAGDPIFPLNERTQHYAIVRARIASDPAAGLRAAATNVEDGPILGGRPSAPEPEIDGFKYLSGLPKDQRRYDGSVASFLAQIPNYLKRAQSAGGLPPTDYSKDIADIGAAMRVCATYVESRKSGSTMASKYWICGAGYHTVGAENARAEKRRPLIFSVSKPMSATSENGLYTVVNLEVNVGFAPLNGERMNWLKYGIIGGMHVSVR